MRDLIESEDDVLVGLSLMMEPEFEVAVQPLFDDDLVEIVEWSFDIGWGRQPSAWLDQVLRDYSQKSQLLGHGVSYSALDASETERQSSWLDNLKHEVQHLRYSHISEHFGFMGGGNFHLAAPLPVPRTKAATQVGIERLKDLAEVAQVPVGLENLAFAFDRDDVEEQGPFLEDLLAPVDGFLLLDLHNIYCQSKNFDVPMLELIGMYPLERVRELHVSGGSWAEHPAGSGNQVRRDTHDGKVPDEIYEVLPEVIGRCPRLHAIILERLGNTIDLSQGDDEQIQADYRRLRTAVIHGWS